MDSLKFLGFELSFKFKLNHLFYHVCFYKDYIAVVKGVKSFACPVVEVSHNPKAKLHPLESRFKDIDFITSFGIRIDGVNYLFSTRVSLSSLNAYFIVDQIDLPKLLPKSLERNLMSFIKLGFWSDIEKDSPKPYFVYLRMSKMEDATEFANCIYDSPLDINVWKKEVYGNININYVKDFKYGDEYHEMGNLDLQTCVTETKFKSNILRKVNKILEDYEIGSKMNLISRNL